MIQTTSTVEARCACCGVHFLDVPIEVIVTNKHNNTNYTVCASCGRLAEEGFVWAIVCAELENPNTMVEIADVVLLDESYLLSAEDAQYVFGSIVTGQNYFLVTQEIAELLEKQAIRLESN